MGFSRVGEGAHPRRSSAAAAAIAAAIALAGWAKGSAASSAPPQMYDSGDPCVACHNGLVTSRGEDVSIGSSWRASMMANAARDPYWQAAVRREVMDHPKAREAIEDECSRCHMPMANDELRVAGEPGRVFDFLPIGTGDTRLDRLAADGVSCTACHQIRDDNLGRAESFTGGFEVDERTPWGERTMYGPFEVSEGLVSLMQSAVGYRPTEGDHVQRSELCATCHTLYTETRGPDGEVVGELPEQVPYLEWRHSRYREERSCQSCHMPVVQIDTPIASVLGAPREGFSRHVFRGGNAFMVRMLSRYRNELGVRALPRELAATERSTRAHLQQNTARLAIGSTSMEDSTLEIEVRVQNLAGHKLPTAYPSRRVWIHLAVRDGEDRALFESGALAADGSIAGNDNDADARAYEPHRRRIDDPEEVQIYEGILATPAGEVTTGLLSAVEFIKDNRLLPEGFDKESAHPDIAVRGDAADDDSFAGGGDRILYAADLGDAEGPFAIEARLYYQPIAYRWAHNLSTYDAPETQRFVGYFESMSNVSAVALATASATLSKDP